MYEKTKSVVVGSREMFGEKRAFNEWPLQDRFDELFDSVHGKAFLMNRDP